MGGRGLQRTDPRREALDIVNHVLGGGLSSRLFEEIRERLHLAMLFITHDLRVAAQVCDHVAVMSQGRVVEYGPAAQVFGAPRHEYTRALFDAAPGREFAFGAA